VGTAARIPLGVGAAAALTLGYAAGIELRHWTVRRAEVPVLPPGSPRLRVLHFSDLHLLPGQRAKLRFLTSLATLEPDLVVNTGDNLASPDAIPPLLDALRPLLARPGLFVWGSNDYYAPKPKNPLKYFVPNHRRVLGEPLPWRRLRDGLLGAGWHDLTNRRTTVEVRGVRIDVTGLDDPHLRLEDWTAVAGGPRSEKALGLALVHSPEPRVLDRLAAGGVELVLAGHTHGGQLRVPGVGALVTNCELDRGRARGLSDYRGMALNVSAGLGTSPYTPVRFACPPEVSLLTLVPQVG